MFGAIGGWLEQASEAVGNLTEQGVEVAKQTGLADLLSQLDGDDGGSGPLAKEEGGNDASLTAKKLALASVTNGPAAWISSQEEWAYLTCAALRNERFCLVTPKMVVAQAESWKEVCVHLDMSSDEVKRCEAAASSQQPYEPQTDIAEWLPTNKSVYAAYASLVPQVLGDEDYWSLVGWKLELCARCRDTSSLLALIKLLSLKEADSEGDHEAYWEAVDAELRTLQERLRWRTDFEAEVRKEIDLANGNLKLLRNLASKQDARTDLAQSVAESCTYHKIKLAKLLGEAEKEQERLEGSTLSADGPGALYASLMETNAGIQEAMSLYEERKRGGSAATPSTPVALPSPNGDTVRAVESLVARGSTSPVHAEKASVPPPEKAPSPTLSAEASASGDAEDDVSFEARMPWDDDEDC